MDCLMNGVCTSHRPELQYGRRDTDANVFISFCHNVQLLRVVIVMGRSPQGIHPARLSTHLGCQFLNIAIALVCTSDAVPMDVTDWSHLFQRHSYLLHAPSNMNNGTHVVALLEICYCN